MTRGALLVLLVACSREPADLHIPSAHTGGTVKTPAPVPAALPEAPASAVVSDLVFDGPRLVTCDEFRGPGAAGLKPPTMPQNEVWREGQDCVQASGNKAWQGSCARPPRLDGTSLTTYHYDARTLSGSDAALRECLKAGGTWARNDAHEAKREAAEQRLREARGLLGQAP